MPARSAGLLLHRGSGRDVEVFLVHPGGPYWANKDDGAWSIPKGEPAPDDRGLEETALREFREEVGFAPEGARIELGTARLPSGKTIWAWAVEGDFDPTQLRSNVFRMEWPPKSLVMREFPEVDRAAWFGLGQAARKIHPAQIVFLERLARRLESGV